jgi:hypothetical protein
MEETKIKGLKNKIRFTGVLATIAGWVIVVGYAALVIAKYAKLPAVENIVLSIDVIAASVTIGIGVLYICLGNQIKRMESIHLRNDIQILFYASLILTVLTIVGGNLPGLLLVLLTVSLGFAASAADELMKEEGFRASLKEDSLWLHKFFYKLNDLSYKRNTIQAIGFYLAYITLMLGIGALLLGLGELWIYFVKSGAISLDTDIPVIASAVYLLGIAYLSLRILKAKNLWPASGYVAVWVFDILVTLFLGGLFGLIVPACLTMLPKGHKIEEA